MIRHRDDASDKIKLINYWYCYWSNYYYYYKNNNFIILDNDHINNDNLAILFLRSCCVDQNHKIYINYQLSFKNKWDRWNIWLIKCKKNNNEYEKFKIINNCDNEFNNLMVTFLKLFFEFSYLLCNFFLVT